MRNNTRVGSRQLSENQVLRLGRTLRRFSRTSREMMKLLGVEDTEVRIPRKKKRPAASRLANNGGPESSSVAAE